ncbi:MAG: branched-chain amino acid ABC transporter substrate-binding protein [Desulfotalea sp.]|nr:MAG: branched-chain amino acid ABC transporter substrate-binding protein [Desulfotalea sp.]
MVPKVNQWVCAFILQVFLFAGIGQAADIIKIGLNFPYTGARESAGLASRVGAEMVKDRINAAGGLTVGGKKYTIEYVHADNQSSTQQAVAKSLELITQGRVLAIIGPKDSSRAIPAGGICQSFGTPMISPTSTNPRTTQDRPYVFRACFLDPFQGEAMASFSTTEFNAEKAAVLYNIASAYPKGLAEFFKKAFEEKHGKGSVVAFEDFHPNEKDLSRQLTKIVASGADVLFVPQYDNEVPEIVRQARKSGWKKVILGGDAWETNSLVKNCGDLCKGLFFTSHFAAIGAKGKSLDFVRQYQAKTNELPTGDAALGYDAADILMTAISSLKTLTGNLVKDRTALKNKLIEIKGFQGVSGALDMTAGGDPIKSATIIRINEKGEFESYKIQNS